MQSRDFASHSFARDAGDLSNGMRVQRGRKLSSDGSAFAGGSRSSLNVPNLPDAREIREETRSRVEAARKKRGVRELDLG